MTVWGALVGLIFVVCYVGMTYSTGLMAPKSKFLQWGCWATANLVMLICHSLV
jgi:uncharacterized membrane protein